VETFIEKLVVARLSRPDAAGLMSVAEASIDVAGCGKKPRRSARIWRRSPAIDAELDGAARENILAPLVAAENAAAMWAGLDINRKRAVIKTLVSVTLYSWAKGHAARSTRARSRSPGTSRTPPYPAGTRGCLAIVPGMQRGVLVTCGAGGAGAARGCLAAGWTAAGRRR